MHKLARSTPQALTLVTTKQQVLATKWQASGYKGTNFITVEPRLSESQSFKPSIIRTVELTVLY